MPNNARRRREAKEALKPQRRGRIDPVQVTADYQPPATAGEIWSATVSGKGLPSRTVTGEDMHGVHHAVLDLLADVADESYRPLATIYMIAGDAGAFARLAAAEGLEDCVSERAGGRQESRMLMRAPES